jgi:hypothetical protein
MFAKKKSLSANKCAQIFISNPEFSESIASRKRDNHLHSFLSRSQRNPASHHHLCWYSGVYPFPHYASILHAIDGSIVITIYQVLVHLLVAIALPRHTGTIRRFLDNGRVPIPPGCRVVGVLFTSPLYHILMCHCHQVYHP